MPDGTPDDGVITVPPFDVTSAESKVAMKIDLDATTFSLQNAFYFARMSKIVYDEKGEVEGMLKGNDTNAGMGFEHFHWFEADPEISGASVLDATQDTEGFVATNDEVLIVVFRGTKELTDWTTNMRMVPRSAPRDWNAVAGCDVHRGFDDGVDTVWLPGPGNPAGMHATIKALYDEEGSERKLYVAGHSLGGALATIAAARLVLVDNMNIAGIYTIGSPRVFDSKLASVFDQTVNHGTAMKDKYFRCRNNNDVVPRMPPIPYEHVGTEIYLDRFGAISTSSLWDRILGRISALFRGNIIDGVNDHSSSEYVRLFKQAVIASRLSLFHKTKSVVKDAVQKVVPVKSESAKEQEQEIEAAKEAVLEASKATVVPAITVEGSSTEL
ncbi:unnamed protein product [Scytosiphon promiscuus]